MPRSDAAIPAIPAIPAGDPRPVSLPAGPSGAARPTVGVLALQGDVREHLARLTELGAAALVVRRPEELDRCDALVIPGGESTTIAKLADTFELTEPIRARLAAGMPAFGTCAGMILLADRITDGAAGQGSFGGLDITVRRNGFGRQVDSFEQELRMLGLPEPVTAVFIRAPWVEEVSTEVSVLARVRPAATADEVWETDSGRIVAVQQGPLMATSFHPELSPGRDGARVHRLFLDLVRSA